jgi:hypothetical protein
VQERADKLREANEEHLLGETLSLLVVAEESLYKWQRLNLTRVESTEPEPEGAPCMTLARISDPLAEPMP